MKNTITIKIQRKSYTLATDETNEYTENLAAALDRKITDKLNKNSSLSSLDAANLVAFDCLDEIVKANNNIENIRTRIKDYVDEADKARKSEEELKKQLEDAQRKINLLREKYSELFNEYKRLKSALRSGNTQNTNEKKSETKSENTQNANNTKTEKQPAKPNQQNKDANSNNFVGFVGMNNYNPNGNGGKA